MAGPRPRRGCELSASSGSARQVAGRVPAGRAQRAFPDTPPGCLKGPALRGLSPFPWPPGHPRQPGARQHVCTCGHGPARFFWEPPEARAGFAGAGASPISWKGSVILPATRTVCSPGLFKPTRLGQVASIPSSQKRENHPSASADPHNSPLLPAPPPGAQAIREDLVAVLSFLPTLIFTPSEPSQEDRGPRDPSSTSRGRKPHHLRLLQSFLDSQTRASRCSNPYPGSLLLPERTVCPSAGPGSGAPSARSGLVQGPGAHPRGALGCTWQHCPGLHLRCCPSRAPSTTSCLLSPARAPRRAPPGPGGAVTPGARPEGPFPLSKNNPVSHFPPQPSWDSSVPLPSLARPLTKLHSWLCGSKLMLPEGRGWGNRWMLPLPEEGTPPGPAYLA